MKKKQPIVAWESHSLFTVFGIKVNLNTVLTTIVGSVSWLLISTGLKWIHDSNTAIKETLPQILSDQKSIHADIRQVKAEQARIRTEYAPPVKK